MGTRFAVFGLVLIGLLACSFLSLRSGESSVLEIFLWLGALLVACAVALWPFAGRDQRAELKLERPSWADRVEFHDGPPVPRTAASPRGTSLHLPGRRDG